MLTHNGPHHPEVLTTDEELVHQARELREFLLKRAEAEGDTSEGHMAACFTLKTAVEYCFHSYEYQLSELEDRYGLIDKAQEEAMHLRAELAEVKRPLDEQMARLNERVIALTAELDAARIAAFRSAA